MSNVVGIFAGGFKPPHNGHWNAILEASKMCRFLNVIISTKDRIRPKEHPIYANETTFIWNNFLKNYLPKNVSLIFSPEPIKESMKLIGSLNEHAKNSYTKVLIFGDETDLNKTYGDFSKLNNVCGDLLKYNRIELVYTKRICSGTNMRHYLATEHKNKFFSELPQCLNLAELEFIYEILKTNHLKGKLVTPKMEVQTSGYPNVESISTRSTRYYDEGRHDILRLNVVPNKDIFLCLGTYYNTSFYGLKLFYKNKYFCIGEQFLKPV